MLFEAHMFKQEKEYIRDRGGLILPFRRTSESIFAECTCRPFVNCCVPVQSGYKIKNVVCHVCNERGKYPTIYLFHFDVEGTRRHVLSVR